MFSIDDVWQILDEQETKDPFLLKDFRFALFSRRKFLMRRQTIKRLELRRKWWAPPTLVPFLLPPLSVHLDARIEDSLPFYLANTYL